MATEVVVEEVAENLEEAARAVRRLNPTSLGFLFGGVCIGIGVGFVLGQRWRKEKIRAEAFQESEEQIEAIREYFSSGRQEKSDLDKIVAEKGYVPAGEERSTMFPTPSENRPLRPPVPIINATRPETTHRTEEAEKDKYDGWNYPYELSQRNWRAAHIIHQDEFFSNEEDAFQQTSYMYYVGDDKLVDTDETVLNNRVNLVGKDALEKFGHGTDDSNIVYVRNPQLELDIEIIRHSGKYAVEVLGLEEEEDDDDEETPDD
jgi:hypothetical protein